VEFVCLVARNRQNRLLNGWRLSDKARLINMTQYKTSILTSRVLLAWLPVPIKQCHGTPEDHAFFYMPVLLSRISGGDDVHNRPVVKRCPAPGRH
jgi:hypothetical protein